MLRKLLKALQNGKNRRYSKIADYGRKSYKKYSKIADYKRKGYGHRHYKRKHKKFFSVTKSRENIDKMAV